LEMLTAKHKGTNVTGLVSALRQFTSNPPSPEFKRQVVSEKPCAAYEDKEPYLFISYAHVDAEETYKIVKKMYESGWDLWYDEGIKATQRYLPVIADHVNRCTVFILMLTNRCLERPFIMNYELEYARQQGIPVIAVLLEEIRPSPCVKEIATELLKDAIAPKDLHERIAAIKGFPNRGTRIAIPPAIKQNEIYDVVLPPKMPEFEFAVQGDEITLAKHIVKRTYCIDTVIVRIAKLVKHWNKIFDLLSDRLKGSFWKIEIYQGEQEKRWQLWHSQNAIISPLVGYSKVGKRICNFLKYVRQEKRIIMPSTITTPADEMTFHITAIDNGAFSYNWALCDITIPIGVTCIGDKAFYWCTRLRCVSIPENVKRIGKEAFCLCNSLTHVIIPKGVTSLGDGAFKDCKSLVDITIPEGIPDIGKEVFKGCKSLTRVVIPEGIINIGDGAFEDCISLTHVSIPKSVMSIGSKAFRGCTSLTPLLIPDSVVLIASNAFKNTSLRIPPRGSHNDYYNRLRLEQERGVKCIFGKDFSNDDYDLPTRELERKTTRSHCHEIPYCTETPRALICCAEEDIRNVCTLLTELYWEGFNMYYEATPDQQSIKECECVLAFFSEHTANSENQKDRLSQVIEKGTGRIIQVCLKSFIDLPSGIQGRLHDRLSIRQNELTDQGFTGQIRDSLRNFKCCLAHPRNFDVKDNGNSAEIVKFHPTDVPQVIVPKTFFTPPLQVTDIGEAFSGCESMTNIIIPEGVTSIGDKAFKGCKSLINIVIPKSVTRIGDRAFESCESLASIAIPDRVTSIGKYAFVYCKSLTSITIPESVTRIGDGAFESCESLMDIFLPPNITSIGECTFSFCSSLTGIAIPKNVTIIGRQAFFGCSSLDDIIIPDKVTSIEDFVFHGCESLTDILLPEGITRIGFSAFDGCIYLTRIVIPRSVTSIGVSAIKGVLDSESKSAFYACPGLIIYTPRGSTAWRYAEKHKIKREEI
jgi:hypothetical protein